MSLQKIQDILYKSIGLDTKTIGSSAILHAVNKRIHFCKLNDIESYHTKLVKDKNELIELIEQVVIPETWFFRDKEPFKMLIKYVNEEWLKSNHSGPLRILSIPCATGEEPYSIAIALTEAGLTPSQICIDAVDISNKNIKRCKEARYRQHSFRGVDPQIQKRFFLLHDELYRPDSLIKAMVNFTQASILDTNYVNNQLPYDVVFCKNLLIYFDEKTQQRTINMLDHLVKKSGILFVGHSESGRFINNQNWNISYKYPKSFAIRKFIDDSRFKENPSLKKAAKKPYPAASKPQKIKPEQPKSTIPKQKVKKVKPNTALPNLRNAQLLADRGEFTKAKSICLDLLTINKQDPETYFLLAFIQMAMGDECKAIEYFRNVVYLEPRNFDALMYLATLIGQQGDPKQAQNFRERAQRCQNNINKRPQNV